MNPTSRPTAPRLPHLIRHGLTLIALLAAAAATLPGAARAQAVNAAVLGASINADQTPSPAGPIRLRQPGQGVDDPRQPDGPGRQRETAVPIAQPAPPQTLLSDFERHVRKQPGGASIRRFGLTLLEGLLPGTDAAQDNPLVPPDYLLRPGDELALVIWGSVDADLRLQVDRTGRISIPRVGPVMVSGVRYADLSEVISRRIATVFRNFQLSVSLGQLRGQRVYVTGFVQRPGAIGVTSLSTVAQALMRAGGPSAAGSFRDIQLRRGGSVVARLDLYDLLLRGDRTGDVNLQTDDVIHVGPVGAQVALIGAVNQPAIFEIRPNDTIEHVLRMAGGFNAVADARRLSLERLDVGFAARLSQLDLPAAASTVLANGDLLRAFNAADLAGPAGLQRKRVRIEGEVQRPGDYVLPAASTLGDALAAAGGLTGNAFVYGTEFTRESVRLTQQQNYERALRDFETQAAAAATTRRDNTADVAASDAANARLISRLRDLKPSGRVVLQVAPDAQALPDLVLEDGDRLVVPPVPTTVGVFGSVFSTGSYLYTASRTVGDYLRLAGGPTRGADNGSVFVVRANGSVSSSLQLSGFFKRGNQIDGLPAEPGDTIFVPEELNKTTWVQGAKDWTQVIYQFGIGLAGLKAALN